MESLNFARPDLMWLAVPAIALATWGLVRLMRVQRALEKLGHGPVVQRITASFALRKARWRWIFVGCASLLLVAAATRPQYGLRETEVANAGIDVVFVVDASKSMLVRDIVPNRLQGTFLEISGLLDRLAGGRVAFVPFAGIPFVQCPLTTDHEVMRTYMRELRVSDMPVGGTNIGRAINLATDVLSGESQAREAEERGNKVTQYRGSKHRAIVLFSDGEDHEGAAMEAAKKAAAKGIRIYTVGVGSGFGDPVPIVGKNGAITGTLKDPKGNPIFSKLNATLLKGVATTSKGKYFHYANKTVVDDIFGALDALEKAEYAQSFKFVGEDRYQYVLGPALLLLLLSMFVSTRTRAAATSLALALALWSTSAPAHAKEPPQRTQAEARRDPSWLERENPDVASGRELLAEGKAGEALAAFKAAKESRPEHAVIWYNLGLAHAVMGDHEEALKALERALSALAEPDQELEADIHFCAGTTRLRWGQRMLTQAADDAQANAGGAKPKAPTPKTQAPTPAPGKGATASKEKAQEMFRQAVERLQRALLRAPHRADIKRNLELARMLAYPPCERRDKAMEPNDTPDQAKPLNLDPKKKETKFPLLSCPADRDLFQLKVEPGDRVSVSVDARAPAATAVDPLDRPGEGEVKLGVTLRSPDGAKLAGKEGEAAVQWNDVQSPQTALVDVRNLAERETLYDLKVKLLPACQRTEDPLEPNDTPAKARPVPVGKPLPLRICPGNEDWLAVRMSPGQGLVVRAKLEVDVGADQLDLEVVSVQGEVLAKAARGDGGYVARMVRSINAPMVFVRARGGADTEASYQLQLELLPPCRERDDVFEDNDQAASANPLSSDNLSRPLPPMHLCPGDDDWFRVELKSGESLFVDLTADLKETPDVLPLAGALTVTVMDRDGHIWGSGLGGALKPGSTASLSRTTAVLAPPAGTYWVRITGGGVAAPTRPLPDPPDDAQVVQRPLPTPQRGPGVPGAPGRPGRPMPAPPPPPPSVGPPGPAQPTPPGLKATPRAMPGQPALIPGAGGLPVLPAPQRQAQPGAATGGGAPQAQPGSTIPVISLPAGYPRPAVNTKAAALDLSYQLRLRVLPPCPAGNDKQEPNDVASKAKPLKVGQELLLRLCKGDVDWFELEQKATQDVQVMARYDFLHGAITLEAFDEQGSNSLSKGQTRAPKLPGKARDSSDTPEARRGRTAFTGLGLKGTQSKRVVKVRISGPKDKENFYLLRVQEPPPPSDKKNNQKKKPNDQKDKNKDKNKDNPSKKKPPEKRSKEQQRQRRSMKRNDVNPKNLEAQEALRRSPFRNTRPSKDW